MNPISICSLLSSPMAHTGKLGLGRDLGKQLGEVGQVIAEELGSEDEVLARVVGQELSAEQFGFADDAEGRPAAGVLGRELRCQRWASDGGRAAAVFSAP